MLEEYKAKYPWARLMNLYTGKVYKNKHAIEDLPEGWRLAFGHIMFEELDAAVKRAGVENSFIFNQVKEKLGMLKIYHNQPRNSEIEMIVKKYEYLSRFICIRCGRPNVPIVFSPWIRPMDEDCYRKTEHCCHDDYPELTKDSPSIMPRVLEWEEYVRTNPKTKKHVYEKRKLDLSETVDKIFKHWEERVQNGTHIVETSEYDNTYTPEEVWERINKRIKEDYEEE